MSTTACCVCLLCYSILSQLSDIGYACQLFDLILWGNCGIISCCNDYTYFQIKWFDERQSVLIHQPVDFPDRNDCVIDWLIESFPNNQSKIGGDRKLSSLLDDIKIPFVDERISSTFDPNSSGNKDLLIAKNCPPFPASSDSHTSTIHVLQTLYYAHNSNTHPGSFCWEFFISKNK